MWGRAECVQKWTSQSKSLVFHRRKTRRTKPTVQTKSEIRPTRIELLPTEGNLHRIWMQCHFTRARYAWLKTALYRLIAHFGKEWKPGTRTRRAHLWDYLGRHECKQTWRKANWNVSSGLKQLKVAKRREKLKEKKNVKMWSWRKMCLGRFYLEKNQKNAPCASAVQIQISVSKQKYIFSLDTSYLSYSIKCQTRRVPKVICAQRHTTNITKQSHNYTRT